MPESKIQDLIDLVREREQGNDDLDEDLAAAQKELAAFRFALARRGRHDPSARCGRRVIAPAIRAELAASPTR